MRSRTHGAIYGDIVIPRRYCTDCETYAFVIDGELKCCGRQATDDCKTFRRMCGSSDKRHSPRKLLREAILSAQGGRCFFCGRRIGSRVWRRSKEVTLRLQWDHFIPWAYSLSNCDHNYVATCHVCNLIKQSLIFRSEDEARAHIATRWTEKGYSDMRPVRIKLQRHSEATTLLQQKVSASGMV